MSCIRSRCVGGRHLVEANATTVNGTVKLTITGTPYWPALGARSCGLPKNSPPGLTHDSWLRRGYTPRTAILGGLAVEASGRVCVATSVPNVGI